MDSPTRDPLPSADAVEFVRFCYRRRRVGWPDLYDEMCAVANRGLYHGWGTDELSVEGIGLTLFEMPALAALVAKVVAEEHQRRAMARAAAALTTDEPARGRPETSADPAATPPVLRLAGATAGA